MVFQSEPEQKAEKFIEQIKSLIQSQDNLIYEIDSSIDDPNVISMSTIGNKDAWVEVTLFNVSDPDDLFPAYLWVRVGEIGADVDMHSGNHRNGYNPTVEFHKRLEE